MFARERTYALMNEFRVLNELMNELMTQLVMNGENYLPIVIIIILPNILLRLELKER